MKSEIYKPKEKPILVTSTYSGILQVWDTGGDKWKPVQVEYPKSNYLINELTIDPNHRYLGAGCTDIVKLYDLGRGNLQEMKNIKNSYNVTAMGIILEFL